MLLTIWWGSGVSLALLLAFAWWRSTHSPSRAKHASVTDLLWDELHSAKRDVRTLATTARPHGARILGHGVRVATLGKDFFADRLYGKIANPRGITASFFLKQIAEDKGERKGESREM